MGIERIITQFKRVVETAQTAEALTAAVAEVTQWLGFRYYAITHHTDMAAGGHAIRLHNYPERWVERYDDKGYNIIDPVRRRSLMTNEGFSWSEMSALKPLDASDEQVMAFASDEGVGAGFTVPNHYPGEAYGTCTFAHEAGHSIDALTQGLAQLAGLAAFQAARRLWPGRAPSLLGSRPILTPAQIVCVKLVAQGKSDWEIGRILGISKRTVASHITEACRRYGVNKRTLLVTQAMLDGTIMLADVRPWRHPT